MSQIKLKADAARSDHEIGKRLVLARLATGLSQTAYARGAKLNVSTYNQNENGRSRPDIDNAIKLCDAYNLTLDYIYLGEPSGLPPDLLAAIKAIRATKRE